MKARKLDLETNSEKPLQDHVNSWQQTAELRGGAPRWMQSLHFMPARRELRSEWGWGSYRPDALATDGKRNYVAELKYTGRSGQKTVPSALAEVLHHAGALSRGMNGESASWWTPGAPVTAVMVAPWNGWLREAVFWLREAGVRWERLRLVEVACLRDGDRTYYWFDEVARGDRWKRATQPPSVGSAASVETWFHDEETGSYLGSIECEQGFDPANLRPRDKIVHLTPLGAGGAWLEWSGSGVEPGIYQIHDLT